jgi:hypothetical protein
MQDKPDPPGFSLGKFKPAVTRLGQLGLVELEQKLMEASGPAYLIQIYNLCKKTGTI